LTHFCRLDSYEFSCDLAVASLPSPAASLSDITTPSDQGPSENGCAVIPTPSIPVAPSGKRKRRLSDADHDISSKRPHNALAVPRLQTVSDPLPLPNPIISELYKTVFGQTVGDSIPGPVSVESLDDTQVEVDFYSYDTSLDIMQSFLLADSSLGPYPRKFFSLYQWPRSSHLL
jgi:C-terminal domain of homeodomain 1